MRQLRHFRDESGQMAVISALMLIPILAVTGLAVDLHISVNSKEKVQYAMDSAVIAGARELQAGQSEDHIRSTVRTYFAQMMNDETHGVGCDDVVVTLPAGQDEVRASADCRQKTVLLAALARDEVPFHVDASATYGVNKLDIAFVFDVSGSMTRNVTGTSTPKINVLKTAALNAIEELLPASGSRLEGEVRIAISPYDHTINAGPYFTALTNKQPSRTWPSQIRERECRTYGSDGGCVDYYSDRYVWVDVDNPITNTCLYERAGTEAHTSSPPGPNAYFGSAEPVWFFNAPDWRKHNALDGWRHSSTGPFGMPPDTALNITYDDCSSSRIIPLTSERSTLDAAVNNLRTNFATNGSLGFAMGWHLISPEWRDIWPASAEPHAHTDPNARKVIIMMTDGAFNTWRTDQHVYGDGWARMTTLCNAAKAQNIYIYTIVFDLRSTTAETILRNCATDPSYFHTANSAAELVDTYAQIAASISDLRLKE